MDGCFHGPSAERRVRLSGDSWHGILEHRSDSHDKPCSSSGPGRPKRLAAVPVEHDHRWKSLDSKRLAGCQIAIGVDRDAHEASGESHEIRVGRYLGYESLAPAAPRRPKYEQQRDARIRRAAGAGRIAVDKIDGATGRRTFDRSLGRRGKSLDHLWWPRRHGFAAGLLVTHVAARQRERTRAREPEEQTG